MERDLSIHISDRSHFNITMNVYNCGNRSFQMEHYTCPDHYIFYYVKEGKGNVTQCQATHKVKEGQCFVVFPNAGATIKSDHKNTMNATWVAFSGYLVERYLARAKLTAYEPVFGDSPERELEKLFDLLLHAATRSSNRYCKIMAQMYSIFDFFLDHIPQESRVETAPPEMYLLKALDFIDINYMDGISVEDIAENAGVNRKNLYAIFKKLTGFAPRDYLIYYRMCKAVNLLERTEFSIEVIATSVGYADQFHFSKEFKKNVGYAPSEYRRIIAQDPQKGYHSPIDVVRQQFPTSPEEKPPQF